MKKFNKVISIEVSVDSIANKLMDSMNPENKHNDLIVEAIIVPAIEKNTLGFIYNALNGFTNEIDFKIGDNVKCIEQYYGRERINDSMTPEEIKTILNKDSTYHKINECEVVEVDVYKDRKLKILYSTPNSKGVMISDTKWVFHTSCNKIV